MTDNLFEFLQQFATIESGVTTPAGDPKRLQLTIAQIEFGTVDLEEKVAFLRSMGSFAEELSGRHLSGEIDLDGLLKAAISYGMSLAGLRQLGFRVNLYSEYQYGNEPQVYSRINPL